MVKEVSEKCSICGGKRTGMPVYTQFTNDFVCINCCLLKFHFEEYGFKDSNCGQMTLKGYYSLPAKVQEYLKYKEPKHEVDALNKKVDKDE